MIKYPLLYLSFLVMNSNNFGIPILFLTFNRPNLTFKVFDKIKEIKPKKLYVACDGPRKIDNEKKNS